MAPPLLAKVVFTSTSKAKPARLRWPVAKVLARVSAAFYGL